MGSDGRPLAKAPAMTLAAQNKLGAQGKRDRGRDDRAKKKKKKKVGCFAE
jgi:hypothetical protein